MEPHAEPMTEEELVFCWLSLVENGQLSAPRLQAFMLETCGERLSTVQARDLLAYMDANGDGTVGREDFRNFMAVGCLADTNAKDFMWTPKRRYRQEHGTEKLPRDEDGPLTVGRAEPREWRSSLEGGRPEGHGGARAPPDPKAPEARPPLGRRRGGPSGSRSARAAAAAAVEAEALATMTGVPLRSEALEKAKQQAASTKIDKKLRAQIESSVAKYEQESWQQFLQLEEDFKAKLFGKFAADPQGMSVPEYHRMLMKWHRLAKWCMPGDLRPADSLAALKYVLDRERRAANAEAAVAPAAEPRAPGGGGTEGVEHGAGGGEDGAALPPDAEMSYKLWVALIGGKYRPAEHSVKAVR